MNEIPSDHLLLTYRYSPPGERPLGLGVCCNAETATPAFSRRRSITAEWVDWGMRRWGWSFRIKFLAFTLWLHWCQSKSKDETTEYGNYKYHGENFSGFSTPFNHWRAQDRQNMTRGPKVETKEEDPFTYLHNITFKRIGLDCADSSHHLGPSISRFWLTSSFLEQSDRLPTSRNKTIISRPSHSSHCASLETTNPPYKGDTGLQFCRARYGPALFWCWWLRGTRRLAACRMIIVRLVLANKETWAKWSRKKWTDPLTNGKD
jgi:hypothetical protein